MLQQKKNNGLVPLQNKARSGFTIIEVLIVLAIAGLIMLIVFLAVPALQRNSRNNARNADAARIAGAVNECLSNNNGKIANCDTQADISTRYMDIANNQQLVSIEDTIGEASTDRAVIIVGQKCNADSNGVEAGTARSYAVAWQNETNGAAITKCTQ